MTWPGRRFSDPAQEATKAGVIENIKEYNCSRLSFLAKN
jgi:hypothetical protein